MSDFLIMVCLLTYGAFALFYGFQVYIAGIAQGMSSKDARNRALLRALTKPAEVLFKTLWAMTKEFFDSVKKT